MVEILRHHVGVIKKAIEEGRSPEEEVRRLEAHSPDSYATDNPEERTKFVGGTRTLFDAIKNENYTEIDDVKAELTVDLLCESCPPSSETAKQCQRKQVGVPLRLEIEKRASANPSGELNDNDYLEISNIILPYFLEQELKKRSLIP